MKEKDSGNLIDKIYLYAKDLNETKYQFLIKKCEEIKDLNNSEAFIEYSAYMEGVYNNINDYNTIRKRKYLIVFDDMIVDIISSHN